MPVREWVEAVNFSILNLVLIADGSLNEPGGSEEKGSYPAEATDTISAAITLSSCRSTLGGLSTLKGCNE